MQALGQRQRRGSSRGPILSRQSRLVGFAGLDCKRFGPLPGHRQGIAAAEPVEVTGDEILDLPQRFLVASFGAQRQLAGAGLHCALARAEADYPAGL
jgi:hypothetical protein